MSKNACISKENILLQAVIVHHLLSIPPHAASAENVDDSASTSTSTNNNSPMDASSTPSSHHPSSTQHFPPPPPSPDVDLKRMSDLKRKYYFLEPSHFTDYQLFLESLVMQPWTEVGFKLESYKEHIRTGWVSLNGSGPVRKSLLHSDTLDCLEDLEPSLGVTFF